jgi:hypothetical protein
MQKYQGEESRWQLGSGLPNGQMSSRVDPPDTPPGEGYVSFMEYAAQHGATYHPVYGWVRWGHLASTRP